MRFALPARAATLATAAACVFSTSTFGADVQKVRARSAPASPPPLTEPAPIPKSVFVIPQTPREGRNPFFPDERVVLPDKPAQKTTDFSSLVLNGITSPPRPMAMINGKTFEEGESAEVKLPNGARLLVQCLDIGEDSVTILVGGQKRELSLRSGL